MIKSVKYLSIWRISKDFRKLIKMLISRGKRIYTLNRPSSKSSSIGIGKRINLSWTRQKYKITRRSCLKAFWTRFQTWDCKMSNRTRMTTLLLIIYSIGPLFRGSSLSSDPRGKRNQDPGHLWPGIAEIAQAWSFQKDRETWEIGDTQMMKISTGLDFETLKWIRLTSSTNQ